MHSLISCFSLSLHYILEFTTYNNPRRCLAAVEAATVALAAKAAAAAETCTLTWQRRPQTLQQLWSSASHLGRSNLRGLARQQSLVRLSMAAAVAPAANAIPATAKGDGDLHQHADDMYK
uniref:Uncharacterized protein n=1 Tax=Oryza punctata TaxID=4537 RepID=A0A0E0MNT4_ORYPU